ncbi:uncharacterized protein LOC111017341 isoform X2 [Momordica charantia]|uniref:Uncharacterized protein LOC111017341 isoform X2 n=1 Tax=Momordica charantia TaxID=3673 RepID=A0A6J1D3S9_MOMCH|nr:uncharacterized protein LOC111017341 isoform X2 [Momordica charantia]
MDSSANTEIDSTGTNGVQASQYINPGNKISTVKLTDENFLLWKFQVLTTLEGHGLESYIECDDDPPPKLIQDPLTGKVLLQGTLHDGLYRFPITSSPDHLPTTKLFPSDC